MVDCVSNTQHRSVDLGDCSTFTTKILSRHFVWAKKHLLTFSFQSPGLKVVMTQLPAWHKPMVGPVSGQPGQLHRVRQLHIRWLQGHPNSVQPAGCLLQNPLASSPAAADKIAALKTSPSTRKSTPPLMKHYHPAKQKTVPHNHMALIQPCSC